MFTEKFVEILQKNGVTAYRVAKGTGISQGLMNEYKNGVKIPTIENLTKIADYLDCSVDYLLGRTDNPDICASQHYNNENGVQVVGSSDTNVSYNSTECSMQDKELLELIQGLSLKQKAKVITYIYEAIENS